MFIFLESHDIFFLRFELHIIGRIIVDEEYSLLIKILYSNDVSICFTKLIYNRYT